MFSICLSLVFCVFVVCSRMPNTKYDCKYSAVQKKRQGLSTNERQIFYDTFLNRTRAQQAHGRQTSVAEWAHPWAHSHTIPLHPSSIRGISMAMVARVPDESLFQSFPQPTTDHCLPQQEPSLQMFQFFSLHFPPFSQTTYNVCILFLQQENLTFSDQQYNIVNIPDDHTYICLCP